MAGRLDSLVKSMIFPRPKPQTFDPTTHPDALLHIPCVHSTTLVETGAFTHGYLFRQASSRHLLLYAHPNAVDIGMMYDEMHHLSRHACVDVLAFEYSGYGLTHGEITEDSVNCDAVSAYQFARQHLAVPAQRILLCGRSVGAAPMTRLCATLSVAETPSLLILQCPFTALSECIQEFSHNAVSIANFLGYNWFRTIDIIADARCPVVLHHGTHDTTVPISHSYALRQKRDGAARPCVTYFYQEDGKGHNNLSRSLLVQIIQDKVDVAGLSPLQTVEPSALVAHGPLHTHLFPATACKASLRQRHQHWQHDHNLEHFLFSRDALYVLLTASVCSFAMKAAYAWQVYSELVKRNARNASRTTPLSPGSNLHSSLQGGGYRTAGRGRRGSGSPGEDRRCSKEDFIQCCIACWGSPLGVHVPIAGVSQTADALVFGSYVPPGKWGSFDVGWHFSTRSPGPMVTVAELPLTPGLLRAMQKVVSSAPELVFDGRSEADEEPRRRPLSQHDNRAVSTTSRNSNSGSGGRTPLNVSMAGNNNCRAPADGEDGASRGSSWHGSEAGRGGNEWGPLNSSTPALLPAFILPELVSAVQTECERIVGFASDEDQANLQTLFEDFETGCEVRLSAKSKVIAGRSFAGESFEELQEWLRPYVEQPYAMASVAEEVPWDYYLFKGRVLADRHHLELGMDWALCLQSISESEVVVSLYQLFKKYYLHRVTIPGDA